MKRQTIVHLSLVAAAAALVVAVLASVHGTTTEAAVFVVTKTADTNDGACNADCSLREAIAAAEAAGGPDTITFDPAVFPPGAPATIAVSGSELPTLSNTTVDGSGAGVIIDGSAIAGTGLNFNSGGSLSGATARNLTIQNFGSDGINMNAFTDLVGATIDGVTLAGNDDGINLNAGANNIDATITNTTVTGSVEDGITLNAGDDLIDVTITNTAVTSNGEDGINLNAGIDNAGATISGTTVRNNAERGININAGVDNSDASIANSTVSDNGETGITLNAGGILSTATITGSTISANQDGGVLACCGNSSTALTVANSTITGNASEGGGGIDVTGVSTLTNVTIADNTSDEAAGGIESAGESTITNSIVSGNSAPNCGGSGPFTSGGGNVEDADTCGFGQPSDQPNTDPQLDALADNGGPTQTRALLDGSPAIDAAEDAPCPPDDQRGFLRPVDGDADGTAVCDSGAYEFGAGPPPSPSPIAPTTVPSAPAAPTATVGALPATGAGAANSDASSWWLIAALIAAGAIAAYGALHLRSRSRT